MESSTLRGNRHHSWNIGQLYLAAMGRSLPEKGTVHKQTHVPDTTGMKQTSKCMYWLWYISQICCAGSKTSGLTISLVAM